MHEIKRCFTVRGYIELATSIGGRVSQAMCRGIEKLKTVVNLYIAKIRCHAFPLNHQIDAT